MNSLLANEAPGTADNNDPGVRIDGVSCPSEAEGADDSLALCAVAEVMLEDDAAGSGTARPSTWRACSRKSVINWLRACSFSRRSANAPYDGAIPEGVLAWAEILQKSNNSMEKSRTPSAHKALVERTRNAHLPETRGTGTAHGAFKELAGPDMYLCCMDPCGTNEETGCTHDISELTPRKNIPKGFTITDQCVDIL